MKTKFDTKTKWNKMLRGEIIKNNKLQKAWKSKQIEIKTMMVKFKYKLKVSIEFFKVRHRYQGPRRGGGKQFIITDSVNPLNINAWD